MVPVTGMESMVAHPCLHYRQDYLTLGIRTLIKPAAMEKLMSFHAKIHGVMLLTWSKGNKLRRYVIMSLKHILQGHKLLSRICSIQPNCYISCFYWDILKPQLNFIFANLSNSWNVHTDSPYEMSIIIAWVLKWFHSWKLVYFTGVIYDHYVKIYYVKGYSGSN